MLDERGRWIGPDEWFEDEDRAEQERRRAAAQAGEESRSGGPQSPRGAG